MFAFTPAVTWRPVELPHCHVLVAPYHDRMPLALADDNVDAWLDLSIESPLAKDLLLDLKAFTVRPMDRAMNNVRQKNLAAIDPEAQAA